MTKAMHLCRGNFQSTFVASGGYEPVAEILFNEIDIDAYFMEYDSDRAGGFEPLRFVPKGKMVVLGLVTSKSGTLEEQGRAQAPHRRGGEIRRPRPALPLPAMRLRLDRGRQYPGRGRAMGEAAADRGGGGRGVGMMPTRLSDYDDDNATGSIMKRAKPPFRADHVGSLLRPAPLKEAREKRAKGEISAADLKAIEDREIERVIKKQEEVGLQAVTDGEFRRSWWHLDFLWGLDGVERHVMDTGIAFAGVHHPQRGRARHRQARILRPSDDRAFQVRRRRTPSARRRSPSRRRRRSTAGR